MINNYYKYSENLASGAQPTPEQFEDLKSEGFEVILNISPASAKNAVHNEAEIIEKLGMDYFHFPVDCSKLQSFYYEVFEGIMKAISYKKVFVHCGGNIKTSNLIHMYQVLAIKKNEADSLKQLYEIQQPEEKWFKYFESFNLGIR